MVATGNQQSTSGSIDIILIKTMRSTVNTETQLDYIQTHAHAKHKSTKMTVTQVRV